MSDASPADDGEPNESPPDDGGIKQAGYDADALDEALEQLFAIETGEDDRRKSTDAKLSSAQSAIGFIVALAGGSVAIGFLQAPVYDLWHGMVIFALFVSVAFFVWAAAKIVAANDPATYQSRTASGVRRLLDQGKKKEDLQIDAINDLVCNIKKNHETNNERLTLYRAAIENILKGVISAGLVPLIVIAGYVMNAVAGPHLPRFLQVGSAPGIGVPSNPNASPPNGKFSAVQVQRSLAAPTRPPKF